MTNARPSITVRAFTLVELLVVVSIIVILLGILIPASSLVLGGARASSNQALLRALSDGAYAFNQDFGYYPPVLAPDPDLPSEMHAADHTDSSRTAQERYDDLMDVRWHSVTTPAVYLLGIGSLAPEPSNSGLSPVPTWLTTDTDPNYANRHDGADGLGIRNPGPDRSWGGALARRNHKPTFSGRVYGPYIDPKIGETQVRTARLEDFTYRTSIAPPLSQSDIDMMQLSVIVDRFDAPIRYYKDWPERDRAESVTSAGDRLPTFVDSPIEILSAKSLEDYGAAPSANEPLIDAELIGKPCAFFSAGPDGRWGERRREEVPQDDLLVGRDFRSLTADDAKTVLRAIEDNQRATP